MYEYLPAQYFSKSVSATAKSIVLNILFALRKSSYVHHFLKNRSWTYAAKLNFSEHGIRYSKSPHDWGPKYFFLGSYLSRISICAEEFRPSVRVCRVVRIEYGDFLDDGCGLTDELVH